MKKQKNSSRAQKSTDLLNEMMNLDKVASRIMKTFSSESSSSAIVSFNPKTAKRK